jgi:outer membrane protein TolC
MKILSGRTLFSTLAPDADELAEAAVTAAVRPAAAGFCRGRLTAVLAGVLGIAASLPALAQTLPASVSGPVGPTASSYQGSVVSGTATQDTLQLTLEDAVNRGLKNNLGVLLSGAQTANTRGQRLQELQALLPAIDASANESVLQSDLAAQGLRFPDFPTVIGPFGYTDLRLNLNWTVSLNAYQSYMAAHHNFKSAQLSALDAEQMVIMTVGNAYLLVIADESRVESAEAQVKTSKVSLDQAVANHEAGTAPKIDELRARVDYQTQEQQLIVAKNQLSKDKLALARTIGLPLAQKFEVADKAPYAEFDQPDVQAEIQQALANRKDRQASAETTAADVAQRKAATEDRLPSLKLSADYGDIGVNVRHSHGTFDASGTLTIPIFKEAQFRGEAQIAQAQLDQQKDQQSDLDAQIEADVRDSLLDIASSQKQVEVSRSNVDLSNEALSEAQQRYSAGVSDNLAVSQAQQTVAQADTQYINSLYQHNVAKLNLARAMGVAQNYQQYLGGK